MAREFLAGAALALVLAVGCGSATGSRTVDSVRGSLTVSSPDLSTGTYPRGLTCDGGNRPPVVAWTRGPAGTRAVAVELLDPDAPGGTFTHWLVVLNDSGTGRLEHPFPDSLAQGRNSTGRTGYWGPCPPPGPAHHYHLTVLALSSRPGLQAGFTTDQLDSVLQSGPSRVLARGELVATYQRS